MYRNRSQSSSSLSDVEDEDLNKSTFFGATQISSPAQWHSRLHLLSSSPRTPALSPASHLPPEILIHILKHLSQPFDLHAPLLVSRAWCECAVELLWHKPSISDYTTLIKIMRVLARDDQTFTYASFIRRLNFIAIGSDLADNVFRRLAQCTRLERLTLVNCAALTDDALSSTIPFFTNLVAIDLSGVSEVTDNTIVALGKNCRKLQGINLLGCKKVTSVGIQALAEHCPLLRRVKLSGVEQLTNDPVTTLSKECPLLLEIDLNHCKHVTDAAVRDLWVYSTHMREMRLSQCVELTDLAFPAPPLAHEMGTASSHLRVHPGQSHSAPPNPNPFPNASLVPGTRTPLELPPLRLHRYFEHLRMLDLTNCVNVTDEAVQGIVCSAPKIRNLVLAKCVHITDAAVESICKLGKHLHYLHLGHASEITDRSVKTLARACGRLRYIDLANCNRLTDLSVFELASLQKLRRIGLVRVTNLTDEAIYALGDRHSTLERVHLSYCDQITVMAIHFLLQKLHKLNHLSLTGIPSFRKAELQQFCRTPPAEFNSSQRSAFCVYSGDGVDKLRRYLQQLFNSITEDINQTEDYDGDEDDGYVAAYNHVDQDDIEMETELEADDGDLDGDVDGARTEVEGGWTEGGHGGARGQNYEPDSDADIVLPTLAHPRRPNDTGRHQYEILRLSNPPTIRGHPRPTLANAHASSSSSIPRTVPSLSAPQPQAHPQSLQRHSYTAYPGSSVPGPSDYPVTSPPMWDATHTQGVSTSAPNGLPSGSLSPTLQALAQAGGGQRRFFGHGGNNAGQGQRNVFTPPSQPISTSPAASDGSAATFFRTYGRHGGAASPGANGGGEARAGAGTPDLIFAEAGHGPGAGMGASAVDGAGGEPGIIGSGRPGHSHSYSQPNPGRGNSHASTGVHGRSRASGGSGSQAVTGPLTRALQESVHAAFAGSAAGPSSIPTAANGTGVGSGAGAQNPAVDGRGRSMKRTFRNTMNAVEQTASSLFGGVRRPEDSGEGVAAVAATPLNPALRPAPVYSPFASEGRGSGDVWMGVGDAGDDDIIGHPGANESGGRD